jgi:hypothetical protein
MRLGLSGALPGGWLSATLIAAGCAGRATQGGAASDGGKGAAPVEVAGTTSSAGGDVANGAAGLIQPSSGGAAGETVAAAGGSDAQPSAGGSGGTVADAGGSFSVGGCGGLGSGALGQCSNAQPPSVIPSGEALLTPVNGWIDGASNSALIQGAVYADADPQSTLKMSRDFTGSHMCIKGATTIVDPQCTPIPPHDCWTSYWGAAISLNLNQTIEPTTMMASTPAAYDASKLVGFAFDLSGPTVPPTSSVRFQVDAAAPENTYCLQYAYEAGTNTALLKELQNWYAGPPCTPTANSQQASKATYQASSLVRLKWTIVPNSGYEVPYDFCVSNVRALYK